MDLCDIQIITGLAFLISGFLCLRCGLSAYHWQVMVQLTWFSSTTHLSGLTIIRNDLNTHPWRRNIRFGLIIAFLILLLAAIAPTGFFNWIESDGGTAANQTSPAICYLSYDSVSHEWGVITGKNEGNHTGTLLGTTKAFRAMLLSIILLVFGHLTRCIKLSISASRMTSKYMREPLSEFAKNNIAALAMSIQTLPLADQETRRCAFVRDKVWFDLLIKPILAVFITLRVTADLYSSMMAEVS